MDNIALALLEEQINENITIKRAFTAYDITRIIREKVGQNVEVAHNDVREIVHETMKHCISTKDPEVDGWNFENRVVDRQHNRSAIVYFHEEAPTYIGVMPHSPAAGAGALSLNAMARQQFYSFAKPAAPTLVTPASIAKLSGAQIKAAANSASTRVLYVPGGIKKLDNKIRLRFPAKVLKEAGIASGALVNVTYSPITKELSITDAPTSDPGLINVGMRRVDRYNNVRIGLKSLGVKSDTTGYQFHTDALRVDASPAAVDGGQDAPPPI